MMRNCFIDIETDDLPKYNPNTKILNIGFFDNYEEKYKSLIWHPKHSSTKEMMKFYSRTYEREFDLEVYKFEREERMLNFFIQCVKQYDWDVFTAWNVGFDMGYISERTENLGLKFRDLSPIKHVYKNKIIGRLNFDLLQAYRRSHPSDIKGKTGGELKSFRLVDVMREDFGVAVGDSPKMLPSLWKNDQVKLILYNIGHVDAITLIDKKVKLFDFFDGIYRLSGCRFDDLFMNSRIVDAITLFGAKKVLPTKIRGDESKGGFKGGKVLNPVTGEVLKNVILLDLSKIYPSIIISANISPETFLGNVKDVSEEAKQDNIIVGDYVFSSPERVKGIVSESLSLLFNARAEIEGELKEVKYGSQEWSILSNKKMSIKGITNSFFGVLGHKGFRLFKRETAESITWLGREMLTFCKDTIENLGYKVVYGDTDSIFIASKSLDIDGQIKEGKKLRDILNQKFDGFARKFNIKIHLFEIDFESIFWSIFFKAKKRYAGLKSYDEGEKINFKTMKESVTIKGFEVVRSDSSDEQIDFVKESLISILLRKYPSDIADNVHKTYKENKEGDRSVEHIAFRKQITKSLDSYVKTTPPVVAGARWMNRNFGFHFGAGDKLKWIYVKRVMGGHPQTHVVSFEKVEQIPGCVVIDWKLMAEKNVMSKAMQLFESLGWEKYLSNNTSLDDFFM